MDKVLLIVSDWNLRQLYHELLFSKNIEVVPVKDIIIAVLYLAADHFQAMVLYIDDESQNIQMFLHLRKERQSWRTIKLILLTSDKDLYQSYLTEIDITINLQKNTPAEIAEQIKAAV